MPYLSDLLRRRIIDPSGTAVASLRDIAILPGEEYPIARWAILGTPDGERVLEWEVLVIEPAHLRFKRRTQLSRPSVLPEGLVRLRERYLDRPIARDGRRAVVNDLLLEEGGGYLRLVGAEIGARGLMRRLGIEGLAGALVRLAGRRLERGLVQWPEVRLAE